MRKVARSTDNSFPDNTEARLQRLMRRPRPLWRLVAAGVYDLFLLIREARVALLGFVVLALINTAYLIFFYDHQAAGVRPFTLLSALYETMRMMSLETDLPIPESDLVGNFLFFVTPLLGLALIFQSILNFGRFIIDKGSRREGWQVSLAWTYRDHVIVCGLGSVTYRVIRELLEAGYGVVAIERDWSSEFLEPTLALGVPVIHGDARHHSTLRNAGVLRARSLVAGLSDDLANVEIGLSARRLRPNLPVILRIFNDELDLNLEQTFGRNSVFSASALAAPTLAAAALGRSISQVLPLPSQFTHSDGAPCFLGVLHQRVAPGSPFIGPPHELEERFEVRILLHGKNDRRHRNATASRVEPGDTVALLGSLEQLERLNLDNLGLAEQGGPIIGLRRFGLPRPSGGSDVYDTVIVCGLGRIGLRVAHSLALMRPRPRITMIYQPDDTDSERIEEIGNLAVEMHTGDARLASVLQRAGIDRACAVVAVTGDDLANMQIGLTARRLAPDIDLVLRVYNEDLAERLESLFGLYTTFSVPALAAPTISAAAVVRGIDYAIEAAGRIYSTMTITVESGSPLEGRTVAELREKERMLALALRRSDQTIMAKLNTRIQAGDEIAVLTDLPRLERLYASGWTSASPRIRPFAIVEA